MISSTSFFSSPYRLLLHLLIGSWWLAGVVFASKQALGKSYLAPESIHYQIEAIRTPGTIDVSETKFRTMENQYDQYNNQNDEDNDDNNNGDGYVTLDIAVVPCGSTDGDTCRLWDRGIGALSDAGSAHFCCTEEAMEYGLCEEEDRLIVNYNKFSGKLYEVAVVVGGGTVNMQDTAPYEIFKTDWDKVSYAVVFANCQADYRVAMKGNIAFRSNYGYLPVHYWRAYWISYAVSIASLAIAIWYIFFRWGLNRRLDQLIFGILIMAMVEAVVFSAYFLVYNRKGFDPTALYLVSSILEAIKVGLGHALIMLAACGWSLDLPSIKIDEAPVSPNMAWAMGAFFAIALLIPALWSPAPIGHLLEIVFLVYAFRVTTWTIDKLRPVDKPRMKPFVLLRALYVLVAVVVLCLIIVYHGARARADGDWEHNLVDLRFRLIGQVLFLLLVIVIGYLLRPLNMSKSLLTEETTSVAQRRKKGSLV